MAKFVGRTEELQWLREEFERVVQDKKPRISVILGDPGQGKTRLVQEFYQRLASDPEWDPEDVDFWPPMYQSRDGDKAKRLEPCPDMADHRAKGAPKFLWLGIRSEEATDTNSNLNVCKLNNLHEQLQNLKTVIQETKSILMRVREGVPEALLFSISKAVQVFTGLDIYGARNIPGMFQNVYKRATEGKETRGQRREVNRAQESSQNELGKILLKDVLYLSKTYPVIIFLDDSQWL
ncbi:MAG: ATP-binding protein, partial [Planctomycetota bacterium]|nr:ATP-binding protein [Planctomycetota bacterium]